MILELKVDAEPETALEQIQEKKYALRLKEMTGERKVKGRYLRQRLLMTEKQKHTDVL